MVVRKLSDAVYRIKALTGCRKQLVVHFDRMKLCPEDTRIDNHCQPTDTPCQPNVVGPTSPQSKPPFADLELIEPEPDQTLHPSINTDTSFNTSTYF